MNGTLSITDAQKDAMLVNAITKLAIAINREGVNFTDAFFPYDATYDLNIWEIDRGEDDEHITWAIAVYRYTRDIPPTNADFVRLGTFTYQKGN